MPRTILAAAAPLAAALAFAAPAGAATFGSPGLGDPFFPLAGNGGYDVGHYGLALDYTPASNRLAGRVTIDATATQTLDRFDLDLRGFDISRLDVDGAPATFTRDGQELQITPAKRLVAGKAFTVRVDYAGTPAVVTDPDNSIEGWIPTADGAVVVNEPQGTPAWFPVNDNPRDKATFDFSVSVPEGLTVMANGVLVSHATSGGRTTWVWNETDPMAPYLSTVTLGRFDLSVGTAGGVPSYVAVDPQLSTGNVLRKLPDIVAFYSSIYGPYPFTAAGAIVDSARVVGYSLETQTKPVFDRMPDEITLAHEQSHMWFGNSVTLTQWPDIWLHEGFATWSEWIWREHTGNSSAHQIFEHEYNTPAQQTWFWTPPPGNPGSAPFLFDGTVYDRGAMTLQALREKVGDFTFFQIMRSWAAQNRHGNVTTAQFITLSEQLSGMDLGHFFDVWLYQPEKPVSW